MTFEQSAYESIFENAVEGIFQTLPDGRYLRVNPALARIYGYQSPDDLMENLTDIAHQLYVYPESRITFMEMMEERDVVTDYESPIRCKDGSVRWISENARAVRDLSGELRHYEGFVVDITERKEGETRELQLQEALREAHHMSGLGALAAGISHDIKTLLSIIDGHTDLAMEKQKQGMDTAVESHLQHISNVVGRGFEMVDRIGSFSRFAEEKREPVQLDVLLKDVIRMLRATLPSTIEVKQQIELEVGTVLANPSQMFQLVINLCTNAFKAMSGEGGVLYVGLSVISADGTYPPGLKPGDFVRLTVSDTGCGIEASRVEEIFEYGVTSKENEDLTGFGLGIVNGIVQGLNGGISLSSEVDEGTTFNIYLPVHESRGSRDDILSRFSSRMRTVFDK